jgi:hypothetical protein
MKSLIRKILTEEKQKKSFYSRFNGGGLEKASTKVVSKYIEGIGHLHNFYGDTIITEMRDKFALDYTTASYLVFKGLMNIDEDPTELYNLSDWLYKSDDPIDFLKSSGYYGEHINLGSFHDVVEHKGTYTLDTDWIDLVDWFDDSSIAEQGLGEDWGEFFQIWRGDVDFEEVCNSLDREAIDYVLDRIIRDYEGKDIYGLEHREEFTHLHGINDFFNVSEKANEIKEITDPYNLHVFIEESDLYESDLVSDMYMEYNVAYNLATEDDVFKECKSTIEDFLGSKVKKGTAVMFDVTDFLAKFIDMYISEGSEDPTAEHSGLVDAVSYYLSNYRMGGRLDTINMDYYYPDGDKVKKYFSELIVQR